MSALKAHWTEKGDSARALARENIFLKSNLRQCALFTVHITV